ncbi:MAG: hypothetical protein ACPGVO_01530 [Spirulinaceae cyanobacterium]
MRTLNTLLTATAAAATLTLLSQAPARANTIAEILGGEVLATANFVGEGSYTATGQAQLIQVGSQLYVVLGSDFQFSGAPDPRLGFSRNDEFLSATTFSSLNLNSGQQIYRLPARLAGSALEDLTVDEITLWCEKFGVPLAEAKF